MREIVLPDLTVDDRWTKHVPNGLGRIAEWVRPYVVGLAHPVHGIIGSGILGRDAEGHRVLTAGHVIDDLADELRRGDVAVVTTSGTLKVPVEGFGSRYQPAAGTYVDAGILTITELDAKRISAWTNNLWFAAGSFRDAPEETLDEPGRVFFAAGYPAVLGKPIVDDAGSRSRIECTYAFLAFHRTLVDSDPSAFQFAWGATAYGRLCDSGSDEGAWPLIATPELHGMSGAPVFTFDPGSDGCRISLVGTHSGHNATSGIVCRLRQHRSLLA